ncbi:aminotransferase class V-fold PLP-dependent enzyme [Patescibacteria group bacterium]|nr:aminotransferase class V-fold PLP-dependent enzyme [Patescibacteria group bacterium]
MILSLHNPKTTVLNVIQALLLRNPAEKLHQQLSEFLGSANVVLTKSGRQALYLALKSLGITKGDEVIVPSFVCSVVPEAVVRAGSTPVFCDVERGGVNMDIREIERLITPRTKVVIFAYIFGLPSNIVSLAELCRKRNLILIEDCAQSFGASFHEQMLGTFGDFSVFSFGISKPIGGIGGGALYCRDTEHFKKAQKKAALLKHGTTPITMYMELLASSFAFSRYIYPLLASFGERYALKRQRQNNENDFSLQMYNLEAKIASVKFSQYLKDIPSRRQNAECYKEYLSGLLKFPPPIEDSSPAYLFFPVWSEIDAYQQLKNLGLPVSRVAFGKLEMDLAFSGYTFSNTEERELQKKYFLLPLHFNLRDTRNLALNIQKVLKEIS